jgi:hypothetical protein
LEKAYSRNNFSTAGEKVECQGEIRWVQRLWSVIMNWCMHSASAKGSFAMQLSPEYLAANSSPLRLQLIVDD